MIRRRYIRILAGVTVAAVFAWSLVVFYGRDPCRTDTHANLIQIGLLVSLVSAAVAVRELIGSRARHHGEGVARWTCVVAALAIAPYALSAAHVLPRFWDALRCAT